MLSFSPVVGIGTPQTPDPQASVPPPPPPPPGSGRRGTLAGERGGGRVTESPNSDDGTYTLVLYIYMLVEAGKGAIR